MGHGSGHNLHKRAHALFGGPMRAFAHRAERLVAAALGCIERHRRQQPRLHYTVRRAQPLLLPSVNHDA